MENIIKVIRSEEAQKYPLLHTKKQGDVGHDLPSTEQVVIPARSRGIVPTGVKLEMPSGVWATIEGRSSTSQHMLITPSSIIDTGYRGELFAVLFNLGDQDYIVKKGDRLVQVIFHKVVNTAITEVEHISISERGESGFGSTNEQ